MKFNVENRFFFKPQGFFQEEFNKNTKLKSYLMCKKIEKIFNKGNKKMFLPLDHLVNLSFYIF